MELEQLELTPMKERIAVPIGGDQIIDSSLKSELDKIPEKMAFKIGEVAEMADVKPYVLRYWESEFDVLRPKKSRHNQRVFSRKDVENVFIIKKLLYRDRFSIEGARSALKKLKKQGKKAQLILDNQDQYSDSIQKLQFIISKMDQLQVTLQSLSI